MIVALHRRPVSVSGALVNGLGDPALVSGEPLSMGMAVQNLMLAAQTLGLGTCVLTAPLMAQEAVVSRLPFPAGHDLTCFIAVGYPAEAPLPPQRKNLDQILEFRNNGCPNNGAV